MGCVSTLASGSRWSIECVDIQYEWIPLDSGTEGKVPLSSRDRVPEV
jgi:hypothetical protein